MWERLSELNFIATTWNSDFSQILLGKLMIERDTISAISLTGLKNRWLAEDFF